MSAYRPARLLFIAMAIAAVATGCGLLFPSGYGVPPDFDPGATPATLATYANGSAMLTITRGADVQTITLDRIGPGSTVTSMVGVDVTWRNADGWILRMTAFGIGEGGAPTVAAASQVVIQRIADGQFWTTQLFGDDRCITTTSDLSEKRIAGDATCKRLRWIDGIAGQGMSGGIGDPPYIDGQDPFDAEVTFEATPEQSSVHQSATHRLRSVGRSPSRGGE